MPRSTHVLIDPSAFVHNLRQARALAPASRLWAVVKADAYGHGLVALHSALAEADGAALIEFEQARELRVRGWHKPVLMLEGAFDLADTRQAAALKFDLTVHESRQVEWLGQLPDDARVNVHLKLNTGMNRLGFGESEFAPVWARLKSMPQVGAITLMSHFANADVAGGTSEALARFDRITAPFQAERSLSNSAALLSCPAAHRDWVRPGIMLYGATPFSDRTARQLGLQAVMSFRSTLIAVQHLQPGDAVGYGSSFVADRAMPIGIVACGYADGYPRHAPTGTPIAVAGVRTRTIGRVSMDMLAVDLTAVPEARPGSEVELWGRVIAVDDVASSAGTIGYELTCAIAPRVERRVIDNGAR